MTDSLPDIRALAKSWGAACATFDNDRVLAHLSDDATIWYNFERIDHDCGGYRKMLDDAAGYMLNRRYADLRFQVHADGFVEQATLIGDINGKTVATPFLLVAKVKQGKITRIEEYFDTTIVSEASQAG